MSIKINTLEVENVKRIKAVKVDFTDKGLNVIGGNNGQGKTSVLDSICWVLGGEKFKPSNPKRNDSVVDPCIKITLSNGLVVERKGKKSSLKVTDPSGMTGGQALLNSFVEQLALNLPKFMQQSDKEKAKTLLQILGIDEELQKLKQKETSLYNERRYKGQEADRKKKHAEEMPFYKDAPADVLSTTELLQQQQEILNKISQVEAVNQKVRANLDKQTAKEEAQKLEDEYNDFTKKLDENRDNQLSLLNDAQLPLPELSIVDGELIYKNQKWDCMSGAEQLIVAASIVRKLNQDCGFVLIDKLEQMDINTLSQFGKWLEKEGLQAIATRVSNSDECSVIIEDGQISQSNQITPKAF